MASLIIMNCFHLTSSNLGAVAMTLPPSHSDTLGYPQEAPILSAPFSLLANVLPAL